VVLGLSHPIVLIRRENLAAQGNSGKTVGGMILDRKFILADWFARLGTFLFSNRKLEPAMACRRHGLVASMERSCPGTFVSWNVRVLERSCPLLAASGALAFNFNTICRNELEESVGALNR